MKHTVEEFNDAMRYAIDLAEYYRTAKSPHREIIHQYLSACLTDERHDFSPEASQQHRSIVHEPIVNSSNGSRVSRKKLKRYSRALEELKACGNDKYTAAKNLGVSSRTFYRWLEGGEP